MAETSLPALKRAEEIMGSAIAEGTRASILTRTVSTGRRTSLEIAFSDLGWRKSPILSVAPKGLRRFQYKTRFGSFAGSTLRRMNRADEESKSLASALVNVALGETNAESHPDFSNAPITSATQIAGTIISAPDDAEQRLLGMSRDVIAPIMSAFAELNGYDVIEDDETESGMEGAVTLAVVRKRERNPRNRLLALRIHGSACKACGIDLAQRYSLAAPIIDIHHLQPIGNNEGERAYNPQTDLVPLCPNCHRTAHSRRPVPLDLEELRTLVTSAEAASPS